MALAAAALGVPPASAAPAADDEALITLGTWQGGTARVDGIALGGGRLSVIGWADPEEWRGLYEYDLPAVGSVEPGPRRLADSGFWVRWPCGPQAGEQCDGFESRLWALGDGRVGYSTPLGDQEASGGQVPKSHAVLGWWEAPDLVVGAAGPYIVVNNTRQGKQLIGSFDASDRDPLGDAQGLVHTRSITASAVWGDKLWKPGTRRGTVNSYDLRTKANSPELALGSDCRPDELQAVGRWLYWRCTAEAKSGVWDHTARRGIPVPVVQRAQLGDGFLVHRTADETQLRLVDFHRGAGRPATEQVIVEREHVGEWTVDKYGGHLAYTDEQRRVHLKRVTVPRSPLTLLDTRTDPALRLGTDGARWRGHWRLSRPAASWTFTLKDAYGRVARVLSGTDRSPERDGAALRIGWDGRMADGRPAVSGPYTWSLTADPGDGTGARALGSGSLRVTGGRSAFRDANADGLGEYYAMTTGGQLSGHRIGASGYWASGPWNPATRFVPFGDIDGDGCEDMLLRTVDGKLWRTGGRCTGVHFPPGQGSEHVQIGTGWNSMDAFAAPGDLTGDGRPDLLARHATTGNLHLYRSNARAGFDPGVVIGSGWKGHRLIGAGDTDRDGHGDLLARDPSGELWRYGGTGTGTLKPRALVFRDWGAGRTDILGVGDITGDGLPDLLSRDANGKLLRNKGDGKGSFGATVTIATGWQHYRTLF
ncbi:FG-GAP-like repeat-containing protein [Streptomyces sp. NPDC049837]|uniref:FG-GAP-like repeat-containing protein n=1 Tax=Streptomyces sp. NPDC049837 TaxID=3155277 RepID=UPI00343803B8